MKAVIAAIALLGLSRACHAQGEFRYAPAPADNPLKGLVPYAGEKRNLFPHSMEFGYLPLSDLMTGPGEFRWNKLETMLDDIASRGHQTVFRVWMEYPGRDDGIPEFLEKQGVSVTEWMNTNTEPFPPKKVRTPDYNDPRLRKALGSFVAALGKKYDGDPRIGYITAGLLGTWGEWHTYPRTELMADKDTQSELMDAFERHFRRTPVLLRYPAGPSTYAYAANDQRKLGYHDDSFGWATLETGNPENEWFFVPAMRTGGKGCETRWKTQPIGGEIRPELWGRIFDVDFEPRMGQDFETCVRKTHATWLMDTGMFNGQQSFERIAQATRQVQKMGYELQVVGAKLIRSGDRTSLQFVIRNTGVAPFYHDWPLQVGHHRDGKFREMFDTGKDVRHVLPGETKTFEVVLPRALENEEGGEIAVRVRNPLQSGLPLRFANDGTRQLGKGWLILLDASPK